MNYQGKLNLLRFNNAGVFTVNGKKSIIIPIEENRFFVSSDEKNKPKGVYVDFMAWENQIPSKYGDTHSIRQSLSKDIRKEMSDEELKTVPYFGSFKPYEYVNAVSIVDAPIVEPDPENNLPF